MKWFLLLTVLLGVARPAEISFSSTLTDETGTGSEGMGLLEASLETEEVGFDEFTLSYTLSWENLTDDTATLAHFHLTEDDSVQVTIFSTPETSPFSGEMTISMDQASELTKGNWYTNIHTNDNPDGEIRGPTNFEPAADDMKIVIECEIEECFRVGFSYPGDPDSAQAEEGNDMLHGYKFWAWNVNSEGGISIGGVTKQIELVSFNDHNFQPLTNVFYDEMVNGNAQYDFLFGPYGTSFTDEALIIIMEAERAVVFATSASENTFNSGYERQFGLMTTAKEYTITILEELGGADHLARTAGVLRTISDFTGSVFQGSLLHASENAISIIQDEVYLPGQNTDFTDQLKRIKDANPDIVLSFSFQGDAVQIVKDAIEVGLLQSTSGARAFFMTSAPSTPSFVTDLGDDSLWILGPTQWHSSLDFSDDIFGSATEFSDDFKTFCANLTIGNEPNDCDTDEDPSDNVAGPAGCGLVLQMVLENVATGSEDEIVDELHSMFAEPVETFYGMIQFDASGHNGAKEMIVTQVLEGQDDDPTITVVAPDAHNQAEVVYPIPGTAKLKSSMKSPFDVPVF